MLINKNYYNIGILGKPHSLKGYLYINHEIFFRSLNLNSRKVHINEKEYEIEEIKTHLKNRFLVKFKNIDSIEKAELLRNQNVSIKIEDKNNYLYKGLPWPAFFINETINKNIKILGYFYSDNFIFCNLLIEEEVVIPYNEHYFTYNDQSLSLKNKLVN